MLGQRENRNCKIFSKVKKIYHPVGVVNFYPICVQMFVGDEMARKKQKRRADGLFEYKGAVGKDMLGNTIRKSFYSSISKADAKRKCEEYKTSCAVQQITGMQIAQTQMSFAAWAYKWLEVYKRPAVDETSYQSTYLPRVNRLVAYFGAAQLSSIRQIDVQKFFNASRDLSMSTLKKERFILSAIFESAISNDLCISNPAKYINVTSDYINRPRRALSDEQIETFERFAAGKRDDALLMLLTGIRRGEMLGLTWEDYDQREHTLHIRRSMAEKDGKVVENPPKWNSYRVLPLSEKACAVIDRQKKKSKYIFPNRYSKVHNPRTWSQMYKRFASRLPEQLRVTSHELRHSYGSQLWRHGVDIYTIQKLLGHKNIEITAQIYVHADTESLRAAVDELHLRHFYDK